LVRAIDDDDDDDDDDIVVVVVYDVDKILCFCYM
jgi:hypothetical protein